MLTEFSFEGLPGAELVHQGLVDLADGKDTVASLLIRIGAPRLRRLGLSIPETQLQPEHALYELLAQSEPESAHSRYNALIRTLVSFESAAECVA
jgi:hypothetical protein